MCVVSLSIAQYFVLWKKGERLDTVPNGGVPFRVVDV